MKQSDSVELEELQLSPGISGALLSTHPIFFKGALFARFKCSSESVFKHWILTEIGESYQHKRHNFILFFLIFFEWDLNLVKYQNLRHVQDIMLPDFFLFMVFLNSMKKTGKKSVCLNSSKNYLIMITSKKYFPIFLIHMQMGNSFNLISINVVPIHRVIIW